MAESGRSRKGSDELTDVIAYVSRAFLDELFDSMDYTPRGKFICRDEVKGKIVWVAVDNSNGEALTEEFFTEAHAKKYLNGKQIVNRWGEVLNEGCK